MERSEVGEVAVWRSASSQRRGTPLMQLHPLPLLSTPERSPLHVHTLEKGPLLLHLSTAQPWCARTTGIDIDTFLPFQSNP